MNVLILVLAMLLAFEGSAIAVLPLFGIRLVHATEAPRPGLLVISTDDPVGVPALKGHVVSSSGTEAGRTPAPHGADGAPDSLRGTASWYRVDGLVAAAGPRLRRALGKGWRGTSVRVCASRCVTVRLVDWCQCYRGEKRERIIDLSNEAFARLDDLPVGVLRVRVQWWAVEPPATDR